ncbi:MAG: hypothetical protein ACRDIX_09170 [Actinomycetota bacterium]
MRRDTAQAAISLLARAVSKLPDRGEGEPRGLEEERATQGDGRYQVEGLRPRHEYRLRKMATSAPST